MVNLGISGITAEAHGIWSLRSEFDTPSKLGQAVTDTILGGKSENVV
jgi:hypothetical protein